MATLEELLDTMRDEGWSVAVHNDYHVNGCFGTFWLFTHRSGKWVKGEGAQDITSVAEALADARRVLAK